MAKAIFDSFVATTQLSLAYKVLTVLSLCTSLKAEANFTLWVHRRSTTDVYSLRSNTLVTCDRSTKPNYLVNEKQCTSDEELFRISGCGVATLPINSTFLIPTTTIDSHYSAITSILSDDKFESLSEYVEIFGFNGTNQTVNSSFCQISSLEVYRGREQAIEISHQGFSLGDNGSIEIHKDQLAYGKEEYMGELYRMNLSCSGGGLPESGCLFFKLGGNTSTVTDKFNGTVPGTFQPDSDNTQQSTDPTGEKITIIESVSTTVAVLAKSTIEVSIFAVGSTLFYVLIGAGGGVIVLTFSFTIICVLIGFSIRRKRKSTHTFTIAATQHPHNGSEPSPYESPQPNNYSAEIADELTLMPNNEHVYHPTGNTITVGNDHRLGQDRYQIHFFPTEMEQTGSLPEGSNNNAPLQSPESDTNHSPTDSKEDLELSQVYDAVNPKPSEEREAAGMVYDQLTHPTLHGKQSLPTYLGGGAPEYSALNTWKGSPHTTTTVLDESLPVYDAPIVKKSEPAKMMPSSQKLSTYSCPPLPLTNLESRDTDFEHMYAILEQDRLQQSTHVQAANIIHVESDDTMSCDILEQSQQQQSAAACVQTMNTESDHTYAILEQDQEEGLSLNNTSLQQVDMKYTYAILEQDQLQEEGLSPNEDNTRNVDNMEHMYAILEQDFQSSHVLTEPKCCILEEEGQPNISWMSDSLQSQESQRSRKHSRTKPRDGNFELVQIYSTVSPKAGAEYAEHEQRSHRACSKKQSLPSYLGARSMEYPAVHDRDARGMTKLKEKQRKYSKKKGNEKPSNGETVMPVASHKISTVSCPPLSLFTESGTANFDPGRCNTMDGQNPHVCAADQRKN